MTLNKARPANCRWCRKPRREVRTTTGVVPVCDRCDSPGTTLAIGLGRWAQ